MQKWVQKLTWKEQSSILTAIRGSDALYNENVRSLVRWLRRVTLKDADVNGNFVHFGKLPTEKDLKPSLEYMTVHFVSHLMHALEIIGYKSKSDANAQIAFEFYLQICKVLHCNPETLDEMNVRLKDNREKIVVE